MSPEVRGAGRRATAAGALPQATRTLDRFLNGVGLAALSAIQWSALVVTVLTGAIYVATLLPGVSFGDWGEMQSIPYQLGVAHPTGYPLAVLIGKLWSFLPIGSVAYRANLLSAVEMSLALGVVVLIMGRLGVRPLVAASLAIVLAAVPTVWAAATTARVDALHLLLVTLLLHRALCWAQHRRPRDLGLAALLAGLALANHMLTLMVAPFVALYVVWVGRHELIRRPVLIPAAALAGVAGLAVYLYIPIRAAFGPSWVYGQLLTPDGFWYLVSGAMFRSNMQFLSTAGLANFAAHVGPLVGLTAARWHPLLLAAAATGWAVMLRRNPAFAVLEAVLVIAGVYFYVNYYGDLEHYLLLSWLIIAVCIAVAFEALIASGTRALDGAAGEGEPSRQARGSPVAAIAGAALLTFAGLSVGLGWKANDLSHDVRGQAFVDQVFATLPEDAVLLTYWDAIEPLWYAHCVEGRRPDLLILASSTPTTQGCQDFHGDIARLAVQRPTYALLPFDQDYAGLERQFRLNPVESLLAPYGHPYPDVHRDLMQVLPLGAYLGPRSAADLQDARVVPGGP